MEDPEFIYKVADRAVFEQAADGVFTGMPVDHADGFIHFSTAGQLPGTLAKHFAGKADLVLLGVRTLGLDLVWEPSRGGDLFPHLYRPLPLDAIAWVLPLAVDADGRADLPEAVR
ncbi:DUF952 domain-containing protein [Arsenicitalea aurantiaca]|uniref:DUF952 domain-containing protein n=1 Tax=Arsenicitalea aurantiaca TaxID=1783274 RepID=A0A433XKA1_9HYPH|nr:DUF952 domain-containing protein [Arsenicitalea aurantiaca]RUT34500.1 DUF952 domain-containing protein [Arsenicitalea aurantiaca]